MSVSAILSKYTDAVPRQLEAFDVIAGFLSEESKKYNLTALHDEHDVAMLHFYDSLTVAKMISGKVIDIGCGAGFPSLPLAVYRPDCTVTMLDSTRRKVEFAATAARLSGTENVKALCGRAEELSRLPEHRETYDTAVSRGVAALNILCEWALPFVRVGGLFIAMKGRAGREEAERSAHALEVLGGEIRDITDAEIPETDHIHTLITIKKTRPTSPQYPRSNAVTGKRPL